MKTDDPLYYSGRKLSVSYCRNTDTLEIRNGEGDAYTYAVADGLTANLDADGEVAGFTLENARNLLLTKLLKYEKTSMKDRLYYRPSVFFPDTPSKNTRKEVGRNTRNSLQVAYFPETDTLDLWNEEGASFGWDVGAILVAFSTDEEGKCIKGFTMDGAAQMLLPTLK
ncbi:MAG: DUF2283 domain-containing protein [Chloroflexi bacterium]|nr:DUF2283 domain-containing protein [Chloroflexota bacterium]MYE38856.1 DUF2283 domain-containing protein [Chloroflexota bacterium]